MKGPYTIGVVREDAEFIDEPTAVHVSELLNIKIVEAIDENEGCYDAMLPDTLAACLDNDGSFQLVLYVSEFEYRFIVSGETP